MPIERPIPKDYVEKNQEHWRKAKRGIGSRPIELPRIGNLIYTRLQSTFEEYGVQDKSEPILTFSVFTDDPKSSSSNFVYQERYPDEVRDEDRQNFSIGISRMNEYATNYATKEFFRRNADIPVFKQMAQLYGEATDLATYGLLLRGTYSRMQHLDILSSYYGKNYKHALLTALFRHDTTELDEIISIGSKLKLYEYSNVNQMAVEIGRKRFKKPDIGKWFDKLDTDRKDSKLKKSVKNGILSTAAMEVFRTPGVVETHGAIVPAAPVISAVGTFALVESLLLTTDTLNALEHPDHIILILEQIPQVIPEPAAALAGTAVLISPFVIVHGEIHHLSADETFMGLLSTQLIEKEVTPYKARLESSEE